jgi:predicted solute-binding protein
MANEFSENMSPEEREANQRLLDEWNRIHGYPMPQKVRRKILQVVIADAETIKQQIAKTVQPQDPSLDEYIKLVKEIVIELYKSTGGTGEPKIEIRAQREDDKVILIPGNILTASLMEMVRREQ